MRWRRRLVAVLALAIAPLAARADARPVYVEVRAVGGPVLGRLAGTLEDRVAYFALDDVARLARGTVEGARDGARATLAVGPRSVEVRRDSAVLVVNGRPLGLSAPVRVQQGVWQVPGESLVRVLPALLGTPIQIKAASPPALAPRMIVRAASPAAPAPPPPPGAAAPGAAAPRAAGKVSPGPQAVAILKEPAPAPAPQGLRREHPAPMRPVERLPGTSATVELRYHSYPAYTRVVLEGIAPEAPPLAETREGLLVSLAGLGVSAPASVRTVRDGLVATLELRESRGGPALKVSFERAPGSRKVFRLQDPPRLVLDFYRGEAPGLAPAAAPRIPAPPPPAPSSQAGPPERAPAAEPVAPPPARPPVSPSRADAARGSTAREGAAKAGAVELRYRSYPTYTRVVIEGGSPFEPRLIESEEGLVVPLTGLGASVPRTQRAVRDGLIGTLELGESRGAPALRVAFERAPGSRKVFRLQDPPRLVLDFYRALPPALGAGRTALRTIVLDPGHGGHDPGATGPKGLREKDLTLDVARRLAALTEEELGVKVRLTRTRDDFVALRERTAFANRHKADLFVSIHVNAAPRATAMGSESYFLSSEASDNAARAAAAFENKVIALERKTRGESHGLLRSILWDLAQSEFQQESSHLAEALQDSLERALRLPSRGVRQAPFYVLGGAAMPAVLVEIGFISNAQEEQRLRDEGYRERIARALAAGLGTYKRRYDQKSGVVAER